MCYNIITVRGTATCKPKKGNNMKTYYIYDMQTNEEIGQMRAFSIVDAEVKYCVQFNKGSDDIYALSERA